MKHLIGIFWNSFKPLKKLTKSLKWKEPEQFETSQGQDHCGPTLVSILNLNYCPSSNLWQPGVVTFALRTAKIMSLGTKTEMRIEIRKQIFKSLG
jgi:hypothetical protein